ncbi:MAG: hypothetical protein KDN20_12850 [Verrucomicrobiae bacterium]|nr:hypothetical protein [Verrucomicrobiae bacterium]
MKLNPKIKAGCGVLTVFGLGFGIGVISLLFVIAKVVPLSEGWKSQESKEFVANHIANRLKLTEEQRVEVRPIVEEALESRWTLRREYLMEDRRLMEEVFLPKIDQLLTEEQRERARQMLERWRKDQRLKLGDPERAKQATHPE